MEQRIDAFLPKCVVIHQWKDRKKKIVEPLFRNYIFAYVDETERLRVLQTQGIVRCVVFGGRLAEVQELEIEQLKIMQQAPERLSPMGQWLPPIGGRVTVVQGALRGLVGEVMERRGQLYVIVRVEAIQHAVKVRVPVAWVSDTVEPLPRERNHPHSTN
jgi:transcription antitermination factor NusG